jgi:hypothetical protein
MTYSSQRYLDGGQLWTEQGKDVEALAAELRDSIRGEVRFDNGSRALYATDASNYRQVPIGVVVPRELEDIVAAVAACRRGGMPVLPRAVRAAAKNTLIIADGFSCREQIAQTTHRRGLHWPRCFRWPCTTRDGSSRTTRRHALAASRRHPGLGATWGSGSQHSRVVEHWRRQLFFYRRSRKEG